MFSAEYHLIECYSADCHTAKFSSAECRLVNVILLDGIVISLSQVKQRGVCQMTLLKTMIIQDKMLCAFM